MENGTISTVVEDKGYGFIRRSDGARDVFFHVNDLARSLPFDQTLRERRVCFDVIEGDRGRGPRATNIVAA